MKHTAHEWLKALKRTTGIEGYLFNLSGGNQQSLVPVDALGFDELLVLLLADTFGGTSPTCDVKMQEGAAANGSDAADITGAVFAQVTGTNDDKIFTGRINKVARKRYIRPHITVAGTSPTGIIGVLILGAEPREFPVTPVNTLSFSV